MGPSLVSTFTARPATPCSLSHLTYRLRDVSSTEKSSRIGVTIAAIRPFMSGRSMHPSLIPALGSVSDRAPDPLGRRRHVEVPHAEVCERIDDRVLHGRDRSGRPGLADALRTERVPRRRRLGVRGLEARELGGARERVRRQVRGEGRAGLVIHHLLEQGLRHSLGDPALHLTLGEHRVEDDAAVIDGDVAPQPRVAGRGVDLDHGHVRPERVRGLRGLEVVLDVESTVRVLDPRSRPRDLRPRHAHARSSGHLEPSVVGQADIVRSHFEQFRRERARALHEQVGGAEDRAPADLQRPGAHRALAPRDEPGVRVPDRHGSDRDAEPVGHDLRERGLVALTLRARAGDQAHRPVVGDREPRVLAAPARDLHVARDADTEQPRIVAPATLGLLAPERVVIRQPEGLVERLLVGSES